MTIAERVHTLNARGLDIPFIGAILDLTLQQVEEALLGNEVEGGGGVAAHRSFNAAPEHPTEESAPLPHADRVTFTLGARAAIVLYASAKAREEAAVVPSLIGLVIDGTPLVIANNPASTFLNPGYRAFLLGEEFTTTHEGETSPGDPSQLARGYGLMLELEAGEHTIEFHAVAAEPGTAVALEERLLMVEILS